MTCKTANPFYYRRHDLSVKILTELANGNHSHTEGIIQCDAFRGEQFEN